MQYRNNVFSLEVNSEIVEYDIKSANTSLMSYYELVSEDIISKFKSMDKQSRVVSIGKYMRSNPEFSKKFNKCFDSIVNEFIAANDIDKDNDIISVKKDAVFTINKDIKKHKFGDSVNFVKKNVYNAYLYLQPYEFYISDAKIDVKGISDEKLKLHENGILSLIREFINIYASSGNIRSKNVNINKFMKDVVHAYKNKEFGYDFYREFNDLSSFKSIIDQENIAYLPYVLNEDMHDIDISYNYMKIILPLIDLIL